MKQTLAYGGWHSSISAADVAQTSTRPGDLVVDGLDVYVSESRPREAGRAAIVKLLPARPLPPPEEVLPSPFSARSRVHEYGGGAFSVRAGSLVFVNDTDQALYLRGPGERPRRLSPLPSWPCRRSAPRARASP